MVKGFTVTNTDDAAITVIVQVDDDGTLTTAYQKTLVVGDTFDSTVMAGAK